MVQQKSLLSFYAKGSAEIKESSLLPETDQDLHNSLVSPFPGGYSRHEGSIQRKPQAKVSGRDLLHEVEKTFRGKGRPGSLNESLIPSDCVVSGNGPLIPGFKRVQEPEHNSVSRQPQSVDPSKRRKLIQALGADDGLEQGGSWAAARAKFQWLMPSQVKDANGRKPGDPCYDGRTVRVPAHVFESLSASQKQYWMTKSRYMDTVLFFKVGKFYELYELDAEIGHKELDWKLTVSGVGKCRQVGCPESGVEDAVQKLVSRGYKVGRMEQTETAEQAKAKRGPGAMVQRELAQVLTPSTMMDGNLRPEAVHLLCLKEEEVGSNCRDLGKGDQFEVSIGFAFVDTAVGQFCVGSIRDDASRAALATLLIQVAPQELLFEIRGLSEDTRKALKRVSGPGLLPLVLTPLQTNVEFLEDTAAVSMLRSEGYFRGEHENEWFAKGADSWPPALKLTADRHLAASALGALVLHLSRLKCDRELLTNGVLSSYEIYKGSLRLDGQTVANLELLENKADGGTAGTLLKYLDGCVTLFGRRLLRRWICHPLQSISEANIRLDTVDQFLSFPEVASSLREGLKKLPDLERLVARLRSFAVCPLLGVVPMIAKLTHQRRLKAFCTTVQGMQCACDLLISLRSGRDGDHGLLKSVFIIAALEVSTSDAVQECLKEIGPFVDGQSKTPRLVCRQQDLSIGNEEDDAIQREARLLSQLINCFNRQCHCWIKVVEILAQLDVLISFAQSINSSNGPTCRPQFVESGYSSSSKKGGSVFTVKGLWHPFATGGQGGAFVPNDIDLGTVCSKSVKPRALLLTGPNMGGKSTLLRATCLAVIMAQLGCYVSAESCTLSLVDTIFTRLGASDRIMTGESTFMVECSEAASVLHHATSNSLVVLDELGRGTSTFDGYAIAYAVLKSLVSALDCRLLFATHYHSLTDEFATHPSVWLGHMACSFEARTKTKVDASNEEKSQSLFEKDLVFLYKLKEGPCPKSYGLQVALLAGIPKSVVMAAHRATGRLSQKLSESFSSLSERKGFSESDKQLVKSIVVASRVQYVENFHDVAKEDAYLNLQPLWHRTVCGIY